MEENLDINNQVNKTISDNNTKSNSEEIKEPRSGKDINAERNNGNTQNDSAPKVDIKNEINTPVKNISKPKKERNNSDPENKDDWDNADNDW